MQRHVYIAHEDNTLGEDNQDGRRFRFYRFLLDSIMINDLNNDFDKSTHGPRFKGGHGGLQLELVFSIHRLQA